MLHLQGNSTADNKISEVDMPDGAGDFRMMSRNMINAILAMSEVQEFSKVYLAGSVLIRNGFHSMM